MKRIFYIAGILCLTFTSCKSEYEERLAVGKRIKVQMTELKSNVHMDDNLKKEEMQELKKELAFHAKISGNETRFYEQLEIDKSQF